MDKGEVWRACRLPLLIWAGLCVLLGVTCAVAYLPLGAANLPISLCIAATKAALIGVVFMRLREMSALHRLAASAGPIWVLILFLLIGTDYFTR
jgi:cytochrome c oxidase subunit IV